MKQCLGIEESKDINVVEDYEKWKSGSSNDRSLLTWMVYYSLLTWSTNYGFVLVTAVVHETSATAAFNCSYNT